MWYYAYLVYRCILCYLCEAVDLCWLWPINRMTKLWLCAKYNLTGRQRKAAWCRIVLASINKRIKKKKLFLYPQGTDDDELCHLVLQNHLVAHLVNTPYYSILVKYVISKQTPGEEMLYFLNVETIANQLQEQGYDAEAGSLMLQYRGTHPAMRTFDMALGVLSRWFSRWPG